MTIIAKSPGKCLRCGGRIHQGETIDWAKDSGATHVQCPENPEPVGREFKWGKLDDGNWGIRVTDSIDPDELYGLSGETITVTARSGKTRTVTLDDVARAVDHGDVIYTIRAKESVGDWPSEEELPSGRYAVDIDGAVVLALVRRSTRNPKWLGVYDADDRNIELPARQLVDAILEAGPGECAIRYGRLRGCCGKCNLPLANRLSVELGIGPVCGARYYDEEIWTDRKWEARDAIRARGEDPNETVYSAGAELIG